MKPSLASLLLALTLSINLVACSPADNDSATAQPVDTPGTESTTTAETDSLESSVTRMAAIAYSFGASWAPDGERIAFISSNTGVPQVWLAEMNGEEPGQFSTFEDSVGGALWSPAGEQLAISVAPGGGLNTQIFLMPAAGGEPRQITEGGQVNNWLTEWSRDARYLAYSSNAAGNSGMDCWLYDTQTDESRQIASNEGIGVCQLSPDAKRAVAWRMQSRGNTNMYLLDLNTGEEQLLTPHVGVAVANQGEFVDNDTLLISTNIEREFVALARIDIVDGRTGPVQYIAGRDDADLAAFEILNNGKVALLWNAAGRSELAYLDLATGNIAQGPQLPAEIAGGMEASPDRTSLAMTVSGSATPTNVWRLDITSGTFTQISESSHAGVELASLVRPELMTYTAHDGLKLSGWLYRPAGSDTAGPMVLSFHGGPEGQSRPSFRSIYQALVARGISVLAPNVRGSAGFGKTFVNLDNGALRFDGVKDIESTVRFVVDSGLADSDRIGIMGGSYGGYMVMAGITEYPDMFAAGANLFGVVNFATFFAHTEPWMAAISTVEYGDPVKDKELLEQLSPIHKIDRIKTPTIVLHGANDTNVPVVEAEQVVDNLKSRDVPVKYVLFPDEGHGWRKTENRVTSDVEIVRWFEANL
ncbi:MAG: S9 family peptidase [Xanthomonadales bacterium]|nr:S9 family peptidase [Xanthomonadales bacterium]